MLLTPNPRPVVLSVALIRHPVNLLTCEESRKRELATAQSLTRRSSPEEKDLAPMWFKQPKLNLKKIASMTSPEVFFSQTCQLWNNCWEKNVAIFYIFCGIGRKVEIEIGFFWSWSTLKNFTRVDKQSGLMVVKKWTSDQMDLGYNCLGSHCFFWHEAYISKVKNQNNY